LPLYNGNDPLQYAYEVNGIKVIMIDNSVYEILPGQLEFIRRELADGKPAILGCHIPLYLPLPGKNVVGYGCGHPDWCAATDPYWQIERRERWHEQGQSRETFDFHREILQAENLLGIVAGHTHRFCIDCFGGKFQAVVSQKQACTLDLTPPAK
ncbi:MAG: metallophosphoesterase, partial [Clostridia bacterium]|nr:metallophosphoesterase [Clostridia bacterium]